jgi:hypothetical protein
MWCTSSIPETEVGNRGLLQALLKIAPCFFGRRSRSARAEERIEPINPWVDVDGPQQAPRKGRMMRKWPQL